jgi:hypothetical protein
MKKFNLLFIAIGSILGGCATNSGVVPMGPETYLVSRQGSGFWVRPTTLTDDPDLLEIPTKTVDEPEPSS